MKYLVTGAAGFIGFHVAQRLLQDGHQVVGVDNFNAYYDVRLKETRNNLLHQFREYEMRQIDLTHANAVAIMFKSVRPDVVIHLAAQAGVRYALKNAQAYIDSNLTAFLSVLEGCRAVGVRHFVFASSSSVYGIGNELPYSVDQRTDSPVSLYAATKKANEVMAHAYMHLFGIATTGLRFFTVYGPWGRPDMAYFSFAQRMKRGECIELYNSGNHSRDFTYIDDAVEAVVRVAQQPACPFALYNVGSHAPVDLMYLVHCLEKELSVKAKMKFVEMQQGDVLETFADCHSLQKATDWKPTTSFEDGIARFAQWFLWYST